MGVTYSRLALNKIVNSLERVKTTRSIEDLFLEDLNSSIEKTDQSNIKPPSKTYKPSGMNCMRQCFYAIMGMPISAEIKGASSCGICESGTDRHVRIQQALEDMRKNGYDLDYIDVETYVKTHGLEDKLEIVSKVGMETKIYVPSLNMSFMTDGIIKYRSIYYIFEFKTEVPNKFYKRDGVDPVHITQGTAYSAVFDIPRVLFLYENRATCEHKPFVLEITEEMKKDRIYNFISECNNYVESGIVPPLPIDPVILKKCNYCAYKTLCAKHGVGSNTVIEKPSEEVKTLNE